jgi:membrane fusion protein (multidrug efflux system)
MMSRFAAPIVLAALAAPACHTAHHEQPAEAKFLVTAPVRTDTELTREYVAQVRAIQHIELRALERGYIQGIFVDEGKPVSTGTRMFQIMPLIYQAEVQKATAEAELTEIELQNTNSLADKNVVSRNELAMARAKANKARAEVALAATHRSLTEIRAPFDGLVGRFHVRTGSLVDEGDLLTTLSDNTTMWVYFNVSEAEYLAYKAQPEGAEPPWVKLIMANGEVYDRPGKVETIEADFNNETGNIAFRATFPNPNGLLRHGETGKVTMKVPIKNALIIPQKATFDVLDKKFVFVVDDKNVVHSRPITVAAEKPQVYIVKGGLDEHDKILVEGLRKVSDGVTIQPDYHKPADVIGQLEVPAE